MVGGQNAETKVTTVTDQAVSKVSLPVVSHGTDLVEITKRASAGAARIAAGTAGARGSWRVARTLGGHGKDAELRAQLLALTPGALRFVAAEE